MKRINQNPHILHFVLKQNESFPNSVLPVLIYKSAVDLPSEKNKSSLIIQKIFARNGWSNSWTNGIYDFHHYHSTTHECLCITLGSATVILGGPNGRKVELSQGDVIILPAGVGHKCLKHSEDFQCVGAYPEGKDYDIKLGKATELKEALSNIQKLPEVSMDPIFGKQGFLKAYWETT